MTSFITAIAKEVGANLVALQLYPLGLWSRDPIGNAHTSSALNPRPVLLVHGIIHNRSAFIHMKNQMEKMGWQNIFTMNYSTWHGNLALMEEQLRERVEYILEKTKSKQLDIVAHSLGGVVARHFMTLGTGRGKVGHLVTLGTPHQGTDTGFLLKAVTGMSLYSDLRTRSAYIQALNEGTLPKGSLITSIRSPYDLWVWPNVRGVAMGVPRKSFHNILINTVGHTGLLYSSEVFQAVTSALVPDDDISPKVV